MRIRESRLYRSTHGTFEEYCVQKWQLSKSHANRLVAASSAVEVVTPIGVIPSSEAQARPLTKLDTPAEQVAAWEQVIETAPKNDLGEPIITAKHVEQAK